MQSKLPSLFESDLKEILISGFQIKMKVVPNNPNLRYYKTEASHPSCSQKIFLSVCAQKLEREVVEIAYVFCEHSFCSIGPQIGRPCYNILIKLIIPCMLSSTETLTSQ